MCLTCSTRTCGTYTGSKAQCSCLRLCLHRVLSMFSPPALGVPFMVGTSISDQPYLLDHKAVLGCYQSTSAMDKLVPPMPALLRKMAPPTCCRSLSSGFPGGCRKSILGCPVCQEKRCRRLTPCLSCHRFCPRCVQEKRKKK